MTQGLYPWTCTLLIVFPTKAHGFWYSNYPIIDIVSLDLFADLQTCISHHGWTSPRLYCILLQTYFASPSGEKKKKKAEKYLKHLRQFPVTSFVLIPPCFCLLLSLTFCSGDVLSSPQFLLCPLALVSGHIPSPLGHPNSLPQMVSASSLAPFTAVLSAAATGGPSESKLLAWLFCLKAVTVRQSSQGYSGLFSLLCLMFPIVLDSRNTEGKE